MRTDFEIDLGTAPNQIPCLTISRQATASGGGDAYRRVVSGRSEIKPAFTAKAANLS